MLIIALATKPYLQNLTLSNRQSIKDNVFAFQAQGRFGFLSAGGGDGGGGDTAAGDDDASKKGATATSPVWLRKSVHQRTASFHRLVSAGGSCWCLQLVDVSATSCWCLRLVEVAATAYIHLDGNDWTLRFRFFGASLSKELIKSSVFFNYLLYIKNLQYF